MNRWSPRLAVTLVCILAFPFASFAPLVYRPGEGWVYEPVGGGKWIRTNAKDQLDVAQSAFDEKDYGLAMKAARRVIKAWPDADTEYAAAARYVVARCHEAKGQDERAFNEYQGILEKHPKVENYQEILQREFEIADRFLAGQWFKLWGYIPFFPSMDKTVQMYEKIIKNGPHSAVAPAAQMNIGAAREQQVSFFNRFDPFREAVKAYEKAADQYRDNRSIASEALFKAGHAYFRQAKKADYDQNVAGQAIATFTDFITLYPADPRVPEARDVITSLKIEQARGNFEIAHYYERKRQWKGARIYYNAVVSILQSEPDPPYVQAAKDRIVALDEIILAQSPPR